MSDAQNGFGTAPESPVAQAGGVPGRDYRVLWFQGDVEEPGEWTPDHFSLDFLLALRRDNPMAPKLRLLIAPADVDASGLRGDDWNDAPANCNAGEPYESSYPPGVVMVELCVGDLLRLAVTPDAIVLPAVSKDTP